MSYPTVRLRDETMREGMQIESAQISTSDKIDLINELAATGMETIVVGSFVSPKWVPQMAEVEKVIDGSGVGICLDTGHANMDGDVVESIETVSEHLIATHLHDNRGRNDDHLLPFEGTIDWPAVITTLQKVGYDGAWMMEIAAHGAEKDTLKKAGAARQKIEG